MEIDESGIIEQCRLGKLESFSGLYDRYAEKIYRFVYYRVSHRETAEDLTSRIFLDALKSVSGFDPEKGSFASWLYRIARNRIIDYHRTKKDEVELDQARRLDDKSDPAGDFDLRKMKEEVRIGLEKLNKNQREVVMMRVWDELSYREISEITGKSEGNCKMIFSRAVRALKEEIPVYWLILLLISAK